MAIELNYKYVKIFRYIMTKKLVKLGKKKNIAISFRSVIVIFLFVIN